MMKAFGVMAVSALWITAAVACPTTTPAGDREICTQTWRVEGDCNGKDQVPFEVPPWGKHDITIRGVDLVFFEVPVAGILYALAGNSDTPDIIASLGKGEVSFHKEFPGGEGMAFHADKTKHLDLHVSCPYGHYQAWYTVDYTEP